MLAIDSSGHRENAAGPGEMRAQAYLLSLSDALRRVADPVEMQGIAARLLGRHLGANQVHYGETFGEDTVVIRRGYGDGLPPMVGTFRHSAQGCGARLLEMCRAGRTAVCFDVNADPTITTDEAAVITGAGVRAYVAVPLVKDGVWVATLAVHSIQPRDWTRNEIAVIEETAERTWAAVERGRAEAALRESEQRQTFLLRLDDRLRALTEEIDILATAARLLGEYLDVDRCFFGELFPEQNLAIMHPDFARGDLPHRAGRYKISDFQETVDALRRGVPYVNPDVARSQLLSSKTRGEYLSLGYASFFTVPLFKGGALVLDLSAVSSAPRDWTSAEIQLTQEVAERAWTIVARVRAESALRESEARFRAVVDLVPDLLWQSEANGSVSWYNARCVEYAGQPLGGSGRWEWTDAMHPADRESAMHNFARAAERGDTLVHQVRIRRHDGDYRWFLVRAEPLRDARGRIVRWFGSATDIHAQRMALEDVERLVAARTTERDLLRRQLAEAEEAERRRLSRELHDQLGQELTAFRLGLDDAIRLAAAHAYTNPSLVMRLRHLSALALRMTVGARSIALELRPPELDDVGLGSALETYAQEWSERYGVPVDVAIARVGDDRSVPGDVATAIYRIAQEALNNIAKHAQAKQVSVLIDRSDREVRLVIEDDGRGFDPEAAAAIARSDGRFGLAGMRERAALVDGSVAVESSPGAGTTVYVRVPLTSGPSTRASGAESKEHAS